MAERVIAVRDCEAIKLTGKGDLNDFKAYLKEYPALEISKEEFFWTKEEGRDCRLLKGLE